MKFFRKALTVLIAVSCFLIILEFLLRASGLVPLRVVNESIYPNSLGDYKPGQDLESDNIRKHHIRINSFGLRGDEIAVNKKNGVYRIMLLGDSYTFGSRVSDNQTFPFFLSERFNSQKTGSPLVEIINAGHSAYSIREEYEYFLDRGISFSPDMVIICWSPNDISELGRQESLRMLLKGHYRFEPFKSYLRNLALYNALRVYVSYALIKLQLGSYVPDDNVDLADSNDTEREAQLWNKYSAYLAEFKRYCDKRNIKLVLVALVESGQLEGRGAFRPQERLGDLARANHVYFLDLSSAFVKLSKSTGHKQLFLLPQDIHFSPEGNRLVADCIFDFIRNDVRMSK